MTPAKAGGIEPNPAELLSEAGRAKIKIAKLVTRHSPQFRHHAKPPSRPQPPPSFFRPESTVLGSWLQVLRTPPLSFRSQAMQPPHPELGLPQKAAIGAVRN